MSDKKIKVTVDLDNDFADNITVQNLKQFYEAMIDDTDDESIELRMHVKHTLKAYMTYDEFNEYIEEIWNKEKITWKKQND